jgi:hypothetical protein
MADAAAAQDDDTTQTSGEVDPQAIQDAQADNAQTSTTDRGRARAEQELNQFDANNSGNDPQQQRLLQQYGLNAQQARQILLRARQTLEQNAPQMMNLAAAQHMSNPGGWGQIYAGAMGAAADKQADIQKQLLGYDMGMNDADQGSLNAQLKLLTQRYADQAKIAPAAMRVEGLPPVAPVKPAAGQVTQYEQLLKDEGLVPGTAQYKASLEEFQKKLTHVPPVPGEGPQKPPTGYKWAPDPDNAGQQMLVPITGGPKDPNAPAVAGSREAVFQNRVINALNLGTASLHNITQLPMGADTGLLGGYGAHPGYSAMDTIAASLKNKLSDEDVQQYNLMVSGLSRNLAGIEQAGLAPAGSFTDSLNSIQARPGDTLGTRLGKLAEARQIIETGLQSLVDSPRVTADQKAKINARLADLRKDIPYTVEDTIALSRQPGTTTMQQLMQQKGLAGKGAAADSKASAAPPLTNAKGWALHVDAQGNKAYVAPNGKDYEEVK